MIDIIQELKDLRYGVWLHDIPSPGDCPEYQEHHRDIQEILAYIDRLIERTQHELAKALNGGREDA